jgi:hypothetical protein
MADWINMTEGQAYAIGILPTEYEQLQPQELRKIFRAYRAKQKDQDYRTAYFVSWLVNCHLLKPVAAAQIADPLYMTAADKAAAAVKDRAVLFHEFGLKKEGEEP